jgi:hypothetical protein
MSMFHSWAVRTQIYRRTWENTAVVVFVGIISVSVAGSERQPVPPSRASDGKPPRRELYALAVPKGLGALE